MWFACVRLQMLTWNNVWYYYSVLEDDKNNVMAALSLGLMESWMCNTKAVIMYYVHHHFMLYQQLLNTRHFSQTSGPEIVLHFSLITCFLSRFSQTVLKWKSCSLNALCSCSLLTSVNIKQNHFSHLILFVSPIWPTASVRIQESSQPHHMTTNTNHGNAMNWIQIFTYVT